MGSIFPCVHDACLLNVTFRSCYRETTDIYSITSSPNFGNLQNIFGLADSNNDFSSPNNLDRKTPFLSEYKNIQQKGEVGRLSRGQSSWLEKSSLHRQLTGELPIGQRCSLTQTVFNGKLSFISLAINLVPLNYSYFILLWFINCLLMEREKITGALIKMMKQV